MGYHDDGRILLEQRAKGDLMLHDIYLLLYANNMVLFSMKPENLMLMLKAMDNIAKRFTSALMHPKQR